MGIYGDDCTMCMALGQNISTPYKVLLTQSGKSVKNASAHSMQGCIYIYMYNVHVVRALAVEPTTN